MPSVAALDTPVLAARPRRRTVEDALREVRRGRPVVVTGPGGRLEADLAMAAEFVDADAVNFMATHARGLIRLALPGERCDVLALRPMTSTPTAGDRAGFTISIEARRGVTTGISASDRARTIAVAIDADASSDDLVRPGHVFPVRTAPDGVLERPQAAEAALDLTRLAGLRPAATLCQVLDDDGYVAGPAARRAFCHEHDILELSMEDLIAYRRREERVMRRVLDLPLATRYGTFRVAAFHDHLSGSHHVAVVKGDIGGRSGVLLRVHGGCSGLDLSRGLRCDCGSDLERGLREIDADGCGVLLCLAGEVDEGETAVQILDDLGVASVAARRRGQRPLHAVRPHAGLYDSA